MSPPTSRNQLALDDLPIAEAISRLGVDGRDPETLARSLPFSANDVTCGTENELQVAVIGSRDRIDLPQMIEHSNYFQNIIKRQRRGELPRRVVCKLEGWLQDNAAGVWENSWVRLPRRRLSRLADAVLRGDLLADKEAPERGMRTDAHRFLREDHGETQLRIPVSYLLKLALVDAVGAQRGAPAHLRQTARAYADHFLCDNTSPETLSFHLAVPRREERLGQAAASEMARRFLLTQLLVQYAEQRLGLRQSGQRVRVYFAPHPPVRQQELNDTISDSFYRELFMNPCLSGWRRGEEKHHYMHLCHEVLSRAQLNGLARLKEAGIVNSNLVVLPSASNISLANNGTHASLGSQRLTAALAAGGGDGLLPAHEKSLGDLVIKCVEHFLPLWVGTYSAAPYRLDFKDFHPEKVLSFLPYELDYTHLRMIWRRWRKKAHLKVKPFSFRLTPFGPEWLDERLARLLRLRGDLVPDFRLIDYLAAVMSTDQSPALDGHVGNQDRLKGDLAQLGSFDPRMPVYLLYRQRAQAEHGFSGFEGRHHSLFDGLLQDAAPAIDLQRLVTALAFHLIATGQLTHADVPDLPEIESERRQIFFGAAIGLPTFFVRADSANRFLRGLLQRTAGIRRSRRYPGYLRVRHHQFRQGLLRFVRESAPALIANLGAQPTLDDLAGRLADPPRRTAAGRLQGRVLDTLGVRSPFDVDAPTFNQAAETLYREELRRRHLEEAWDVLVRDLRTPAFRAAVEDPGVRRVLRFTIKGRDPGEALARMRADLLSGTAGPAELMRAINLVLMVIASSAREAGARLAEVSATAREAADAAPVHRAADR